MSVLIKNMEMPTDDSIRIILFPNGRVVKSNAVDYEEFEAIPVPPHGRLIDADALNYSNTDYCGNHFVYMVDIEDSPTIIGSEGEDD